MKTAFVFPGQGSQSVGMLADLSQSFPIVGETFAQASAVLGYDLWKVVQQGPDAELNQTSVTQPAMLVAGIAVYRCLKQQMPPIEPVFMAGHSLGEYTALVAAEALSLEQGVELVAQRGKLMQQAVAAGEGAMAAILGLEDDQVVEVCQMAAGDQVVEAVNFNSPGQVVIAGNNAAVEKAMQLAQEKGAKKVVPLPVSVPSHCSLMKPAAAQLAEKLASMSISSPRVPVVHNVSVECYDNAQQIKTALVEQLYRPVQWVKTIEFMKSQGVEQLYELGPGKVLAGLNRRIDRRMAIEPIFDTDGLNKVK